MRGEAPQATEKPAALLRIACVYGVLPDKWQRRWRENRPDVTTSWEFIDSGEQWEGLRDGRWDIVLARTTIPEETERAHQLLSYPPSGLEVPEDLQTNATHVHLFAESLVVIARKKHDCTLTDSVSVADYESLPDPRIGQGQLEVPLGQAELALTYAESGAGIGILPTTLVKALGAEYTGVQQELVAPPVTQVSAWWLNERPETCPEDVIQDFVGALRGRRAKSARSQSAEASKASQKAKRRAKIAASRERTQKSNKRQRQSRTQGRSTKRERR